MHKKKHLNAATTISLSFVGIILLGSVLLHLPISQRVSSQATYIDHLFNAVSATCVTGLFIESVADSYNLLGKTILLTLIQIGGLGTLTVFALALRFMNKQLTHYHKRTMTFAVNHRSIEGLNDFIFSIIKYTLIIEGSGALLLSLFFVPERGLWQGLYSSLFLAISAFCNAGFDPFGTTSLAAYASHVPINLTLCALIVLGGLGFGVWFDIADHIRYHYQARSKTSLNIKAIWKAFKPHTKMVLGMTLFLIVGGWLTVLIIEWKNPQSLGPMPWPDKLLRSFFQSISMRTAGFSTMNYDQVYPSSLLVWIMLMFVGGAPAGTAGGLKVTTMAILILFMRQMFLNRNYIHFDRHNITDASTRMASVLAILYGGCFFATSFLLQVFEPHVPLIHLMFEAVSALATVGVSVNLTPTLSSPSHLLLMLIMFIGRIGPMTIVTALFNQSPSKNNIRYSDTTILIG